MPIKNRIRHWRQELGYEDCIQFAGIIGFSAWMVERWEEQRIQPTLEALCKVRERLLPHCHGLKLEDLIDYIPED